MRTLGEIVESLKDGFEPTKDELYYALLTISFLHNVDHRLVMQFPEKQKNPIWAKLQSEESFKRFKSALGQDVKEYVGWNNDPHNPDYQKERLLHKKILDKVLKDVG